MQQQGMNMLTWCGTIGLTEVGFCRGIPSPLWITLIGVFLDMREMHGLMPIKYWSAEH